MQAKPTSSVIKGVVISLLLIVFNITTLITGSQEVSGLQIVGYVIFLGGLVWAINSYARQIQYNATFGKYFLHGFAVTAIITCLMVIFMALYINFDPSMKQKAIDKAAEAIRNNPAYTEEQAEQALDITKRFFTPMILGSTVLMYMFFGTLASLITAAIVKKNPRPYDEATNFEDIKPIE